MVVAYFKVLFMNISGNREEKKEEKFEKEKSVSPTGVLVFQRSRQCETGPNIKILIFVGHLKNSGKITP